jgi:hypothetical protein
MSTMKVMIIVAALVAGAAIPLYLQRDTNQRLQAEVERLQKENTDLLLIQEQARAAAPSAEEERRQRRDRDEILQLRAEVAELRRRVQETAKAAPQTAQKSAPAQDPRIEAPNPGPPVLEGFIPAASWANAGQTTPAAAYETFQWAKARGDTQTLAKTLVMDESAQQRAEQIYASLPREVQSKFSNPHEMVTKLLADSTQAAGMRFLSQQEQGQDEVLLMAQWQYVDGRIRDGEVRFHRYEDGWRQVVPEGIVQKLSLSLVPPPPGIVPENVQGGQ